MAPERGHAEARPRGERTEVRSPGHLFRAVPSFELAISQAIYTFWLTQCRQHQCSCSYCIIITSSSSALVPW
jgi:hypothetical protein